METYTGQERIQDKACSGNLSEPSAAHEFRRWQKLCVGLINVFSNRILFPVVFNWFIITSHKMHGFSLHTKQLSISKLNLRGRSNLSDILV